jgi:hypothetical protein
MFLQEFFILPESNKVIKVKNDVRKLGVEFAFVEVFIYYFQVGEKSILF